MIVSDVIGSALFAALFAWNALTLQDAEVAALLASAVLGHVCFELLFSEVSSKCTPHPWRDLRAVLGHRAFLIYALNLAATWYLAHVLPYHVLPLERFGGYVTHLAVLGQRNVREFARKEERRPFVRKDVGMSWERYAVMMNMVTLPHNVLRYHFRYIVLRLTRHAAEVGTLSVSHGLPSVRAVAFFCVAYWVYRRVLQPQYSAFTLHHYQIWHRWFHEDKLLWRSIHKFHHLFKHPGPLSSSTETHMEWAMSWASCASFADPFYILFLFHLDGVDASEVIDHDILSSRDEASWMNEWYETTAVPKVQGHVPNYHALHHMCGTGNFSESTNDEYYATLVPGLRPKSCPDRPRVAS